jgi:histidine triad (HIT) family protein
MDKDLLDRIIRSTFGRLIIGWTCAHMSWAIPVQRLYETENLLAFHHPKPSYGLHILLVPKKAIDSIEALTAADSEFLVDVTRAVQSLAEQFQLQEHGYRLIVNGGRYQEVPQLHFHLISDL